MSTPDEASRVDFALSAWRQGDCALGAHRFLYRADPAYPLQTPSTKCDRETGNSEMETPGFVVLTQTCDLVRTCAERPFVELAPLMEVDQVTWRTVERGRQPRHAVVPGLTESRLVADLDRVMTVEKTVVARWTRVPGCRTDDEARGFALALSRKRARMAFPDDFVIFVRKLQLRMSDKHDKDSVEGRGLRALREVRVRAAPSWESDTVELTLYFIRDEGAMEFAGVPWSELLERWLELVPDGGRFQVEGLVQTLHDLTAADYVESDPLDLGYLSDRAA